MKIDVDRNNTRAFNYAASASTMAEFINNFLNSISPSHLEGGIPYCGFATWSGHTTVSFNCIVIGNATLFTLFQYDKIYNGYIDKQNNKQCWAFTGTLYPLT